MDAWRHLEAAPSPEEVLSLVSVWDCASKTDTANDYSANLVLAELKSELLAVTLSHLLYLIDAAHPDHRRGITYCVSFS